MMIKYEDGYGWLQEERKQGLPSLAARVIKMID